MADGEQKEMSGGKKMDAYSIERRRLSCCHVHVVFLFFCPLPFFCVLLLCSASGQRSRLCLFLVGKKFFGHRLTWNRCRRSIPLKCLFFLIYICLFVCMCLYTSMTVCSVHAHKFGYMFFNSYRLKTPYTLFIIYLAYKLNMNINFNPNPLSNREQVQLIEVVLFCVGCMMVLLLTLLLCAMNGLCL